MKKINRLPWSIKLCLLAVLLVGLFFTSSNLTKQILVPLACLGHNYITKTNDSAVNEILPEEKPLVSQVESLDSIIKEIIFIDQIGSKEDTELIGDNVKQNLGVQYDARLPQGSSIFIAVSQSDFSNPKRLFIGGRSTAKAIVRVFPKFNPQDKRYDTELPQEGFKLEITLYLKKIDPEEISHLITLVIKQSLPKEFTRPKKKANTNVTKFV